MKFQELKENILVRFFISSLGFLAIALYFPHSWYIKGDISSNDIYVWVFALFILQIMLYGIFMFCINSLTLMLIEKITLLNSEKTITFPEIETPELNKHIAKILSCIFGFFAAHTLTIEEIIWWCFVIFCCMLYLLHIEANKR